MKIRSIEKNQSTGELVVNVQLNYQEVDYLKGVIGVCESHKLMDHDDPEQIELAKNLKEGFLDAKGKLRP